MKPWTCQETFEEEYPRDTTLRLEILDVSLLPSSRQASEILTRTYPAFLYSC
jgi:hypothetical protein